MIALIVVLGLLAFSHVAPVPFLFDALSGKLTVWRMPEAPGDRNIFLTFDDGPNPAVTPEILDLLQARQVPATFFLIDRYVNEETAPIVRRMFAEGHGVALHSGDRWLMFRSPGGLVKRLQQASDRIESLTGSPPCPLFRPHAGLRSISMLRGLSRIGYRLVGWSWRTWDFVWFRKRTGKRVADQVLAHAAPGKIVVIHDGHHRKPRAASRRYALEAAERIIDGLQAQGYQLKSLCP